MDSGTAEKMVRQALASQQSVMLGSLLVLLLAVFLVYRDVGPYLAADGDGALQTAAGQAAAMPVGSDVSQSAREIAALHLFGSVAAGTVREKRPVSAPDTRLSLVLNGTVASDTEGFAYALITNASKQTRSFSIGDRVFGMAELEEIYTDRVILSRNGRNETLRLPEKRAATSGKGVTRGRTSADIRALQQQRAGQPASRSMRQ